MQSPRRRFVSAFRCLCAVFISHALGCASVPVPNSNCYAFDNSSRLVDFSGLIGKEYEYALKDNADLVVRFCKSVETRAQSGYINYGRFDQFNYFTSGSGHVDFIQRFYGGDLAECERSYDHLGRTAQVNIACGSCLNGQCKGLPDCICNVTFSYCRVSIDLALSCNQTGSRVLEGFTVGFHPRSWEIVYDGMTQLGFEKPYLDYSFRTEQTHATLYMTSIASQSTLVGKPIVEVIPKTGLDIKLSGTGAAGVPPTTLSPTSLILEWRCMLIDYGASVSIACLISFLLKISRDVLKVRKPGILHMKLMSLSQYEATSLFNFFWQNCVNTGRPRRMNHNKNGLFSESYLAYLWSLQHCFAVGASSTRHAWNTCVGLTHCQE